MTPSDARARYRSTEHRRRLRRGQPRKWDGQLLGLDLDRLRAEVRESRDAILEREARHEGAAV
jgi:hypothetical protein